MCALEAFLAAFFFGAVGFLAAFLAGLAAFFGSWETDTGGLAWRPALFWTVLVATRAAGDSDSLSSYESYESDSSDASSE